MEPIHIIIAEDNETYLSGICTLLRPYDRLIICGTAQNGLALISLLKEIHADVILMDVQMPVMDGIEATNIIVKNYPAIKVLALSQLDDAYKIVDMIRAGCHGYVNKNSNAGVLVNAIESVFNGAFELCHTTSARVQKMIVYNELKLQKPGDKFTETELKIIQYMCIEYSNKEIMKSMYIAGSTFKRLLRQIKSKCEADTRTAVIRYAMMHGLHKESTV